MLIKNLLVKYQKLVKAAYASDKAVLNQLELAIAGKSGGQTGVVDLTVETNALEFIKNIHPKRFGFQPKFHKNSLNTGIYITTESNSQNIENKFKNINSFEDIENLLNSKTTMAIKLATDENGKNTFNVLCPLDDIKLNVNKDYLLNTNLPEHT
ncbi:9641_t:CDS:2, partial [Gigaspora margarita]